MNIKFSQKRHLTFILKTILFTLFISILSCNGQDQKTTCKQKTITKDSIIKKTNSQKTDYTPFSLSSPPISDFVRRIFEDTKGHLWFGTNGDGVARYNGENLDYFSIDEGFNGLAVRSILEDKKGNIWFATNNGIIKYDGTSFTSYTKKDGLIHNDIWSMYIDTNNLIWIATFQGISQFDGTTFTHFSLPENPYDSNRGVSSTKIVHSIMQDHKGRMWFGTNGGAYIYDGTSLSTLSEKDGLVNNAVNDILEDQQGNIWFATHYKGISKYDGTTFINYTKDGVINGDEIWSLFEDKDGNIWFPAENYGIYKYDGNTFTNYQEAQGLTTNAVQSIYQDKKGDIWAGGWKGLFRKNGTRFEPIFIDGPWGK